MHRKPHTWHFGDQDTDMWKKWLKNNLLFVYQLFKNNLNLVKYTSENAPTFKPAWNNKSEDWYQGYHAMQSDQWKICREKGQLWVLLVPRKACLIGSFIEIHVDPSSHPQAASNVWHSIPKPFLFVSTKKCPWWADMPRFNNQPWTEIKQMHKSQKEQSQSCGSHHERLPTAILNCVCMQKC